MKKIYCDHCKKEINGMNDYTDYEFQFEDMSYRCDLCKTCKEKIENQIDKTLMELLGWNQEIKKV